MTTLKQRFVRVTVGSGAQALEIEGLRTTFRIAKDLRPQPDKCEVVLYNLAENTRGQLNQRWLRVQVEAGYTDTFSRIFSGDARYVDHSHMGADWVTKLQLGDGERAFRHSLVAESFRPGTPVATVFRRVAQATGLDVTDACALVQSTVTDQFTQGYVAYGSAIAELERLLVGRLMTWTVEDGRLVLTSTGQPRALPVVVLSADTGLVGSVEHGTSASATPTAPAEAPPPPVLKARSLLQPLFRAGGKVQLDARTTKGLFRITALTHTGDTHGGEWYTDLELAPLSK